MEIKLRFGNQPENPSPGSSKPVDVPDQREKPKRELQPAPPRGLNLLRPREKSQSNGSTPEPEGSSAQKIEEVLSELNSLVGLQLVKKLVNEICAFVDIQKKRTKEHLATQPLVLHMIFRGNPGTGKTTVSRILGRLLKEAGVLQKGHLVEVERADLVGEYIGHTAQKTREHIRKSVGGVLFIDEAYSLARGGERDFGKEAIDSLVKGMEDNKDNLVLILAGYKEEMDWFLQTNPGLRSRFPIHLDFPDYSVSELMDIALLMLKQRDYFLSWDAQTMMEKMFRRVVLFGHEYSGNARMVRNLIEHSIRRQAVRLVTLPKVTREDLMRIEVEDLLDENKVQEFTKSPLSPTAPKASTENQ
ncbi:MAG: AAA family ATPase [Bacillota bacterium]